LVVLADETLGLISILLTVFGSTLECLIYSGLACFFGDTDVGYDFLGEGNLSSTLITCYDESPPRGTLVKTIVPGDLFLYFSAFTGIATALAIFFGSSALR
jgi:hypothetical protein